MIEGKRGCEVESGEKNKSEDQFAKAEEREQGMGLLRCQIPAAFFSPLFRSSRS